jgi:hypothetical protein
MARTLLSESASTSAASRTIIATDKRGRPAGEPGLVITDLNEINRLALGMRAKNSQTGQYAEGRFGASNALGREPLIGCARFTFSMHQQVELNAIPGALETRLGIPRPNWLVIWDWIEANVDEGRRNATWSEIARQWLESIRSALSQDYTIRESDEFFLLSALDDSSAERVLRWCERARRSILECLPGVAQDEGCVKHVVLAFDAIDTYYDYVADSYLDGEFGTSGGIFINDGYGHIVIWTRSRFDLERTIIHELTHAMLDHLPLPAWLNEGTTQFMEDVVLESSTFAIDHEMVQRHRAYWSEESIQAFWSGESFYFADDGQELSYHLAEVLVRNLCSDYRQKFRDFLRAADRRDAGDSAARSVFGVSLADRVAQFIGPGDWQPRDDYAPIADNIENP